LERVLMMSSYVDDSRTGLLSRCAAAKCSYPQIPWTGNQAYGKNLRIQMGRCPVRSIFPQALDMLKKKQDLLG
jgi:hypothetical protein